MERRGFFRSLLGLAALPFVPVEKIIKALQPAPAFSFTNSGVWTATASDALYFNTSTVFMKLKAVQPKAPENYEEDAKEYEPFWKDATLEELK